MRKWVRPVTVLCGPAHDICRAWDKSKNEDLLTTDISLCALQNPVKPGVHNGGLSTHTPKSFPVSV